MCIGLIFCVGLIYVFVLNSMFEDYISAKYPNVSAKELSVKRATEYHSWVKDYVCMNIIYINFGHLYFYIFDIVYFYICRSLTGALHTRFLLGLKR